jgi:hypothetical protein
MTEPIARRHTVKRENFLSLLLVPLAIAAAAFMPACHSELRFDDHSIEADAGMRPGDAGVPDSVPNALDALACPAIRCGYLAESCGATSCELECPQQGQCTGACGAGCTTDCEEDSLCSLITDSGARLRCEARARCSFMLGDDSEGRCEIGSRCNIQCAGTCALLCDSGATCTYACAPGAPMTPFTGHAGCP